MNGTMKSVERRPEQEQDVCVCVLAHNEQKHIASTIKAIVEGNRDIGFDIIVYANGCTDNTVKIVQSLFATYQNLRLRELEKASKTLAWNTAFNENTAPIMVFSDGDVEIEPGTVAALCGCIDNNPAITIASCQYWPKKKRLSFEQKLTGLMQIPLVQDFLTGCFYGVRRANLEAEFSRYNLPGIPDGLVGEDFFLSNLVPDLSFTVIGEKCYYEPPSFEDYRKYLARIQWQEQQAALVCGNCLNLSVGRRRKLTEIIKRKMPHCQGMKRLLVGILAVTMRYLFIFIYQKRIKQHYQCLGSVTRQGEFILCNATRSNSAK